jgi:microcystin-dependent protein
MGTPFIGEIRMTSFGFAAKGWALCEGQSLPISTNQALFALLGTMYGGDGVTNFKLPDLRGRAPIHFGQNAQGTRAGEEAHTLLAGELPMHTHSVYGSTNAADQANPQDAYWAGQTGQAPFANSANAELWSGAITTAGNSQAHENMAPFLTISFMIALTGMFPPRN